ncbi:MAG: TRAP transporter small permease [Spirochaetaceae bacterium]|jgi:TRAP-type C4-dicarboxylate transport system permease small subunit|nr:TRAP transporter small permease [Spirochaetaceae bacterium]
MKKLKWLDDNAEQCVCIILMSAMTIILFIQVVMRRVFSNSLTWSEELARYLFIWLVYFGISYGAKIRKHIKIEAFLGVFPQKIRPFIEILGDILFFAFAVFVIWTAYQWVGRQVKLRQKSPALHIPMWMIYAAPLAGFTLTAFRQIQTIIYRVKTIHQGGSHD